jgi:hypothetical protein
MTQDAYDGLRYSGAFNFVLIGNLLFGMKVFVSKALQKTDMLICERRTAERISEIGELLKKEIEDAEASGIYLSASETAKQKEEQC